jgi:hypothetical protein
MHCHRHREFAAIALRVTIPEIKAVLLILLVLLAILMGVLI